MARIAGVDLPRGKRIGIALTYIHGIGRTSSRNLLDKVGIEFNEQSDALKDQDIAKIREIIDREFKVEGDLRREVSMDIKRLMDIASYRGLRHRKGLPVHGQRTSTNARTRKGPRRAIVKKKSKG